MSKQKIFQSGSIKNIDKKSREITFVISDGQVDRHGDSLNPNGWLIDNYMQNPVVLFGHNYKDLPIAKTLKIWVENGSQVLARMKFASHDFANKVWELIEGEFLNATSVGFIPLKLDEEGNYTWSQQELLEVSVVPVPANPRALGKKEMAIVKELEKTIGESILEEEKAEITTPEAENTEKELKKMALLDENQLKELIKQAISEYVDQQTQKEVEGTQEAEAKTKEALIAMRELLKSSDKSTELALKRLKELVG